ncbi:putative disease resistance protein [Citrus sinensis]|uniref:Disease resistance protein n=1 Tax=Citrus sinensis TaxID=2711 RepID=A0ACB8JAB1_CITSI|nr:putative disease resistance protein [Citrus sinensis]
MYALRVLDSSQNAKLSKLHVGEGELIDLQYLNLSNTNICELPIGIKSCTHLRTLLLDGTENLKAIPVGMLSSLLSLRVFSWVPTRYAGFNYGSSVPGVTVLLLEELESLKHLQEISVIILTIDSLNKLKSSLKLQSCIRRLVMGLPEAIFSQDLQDLSIINCSIKDLTCIVYIPRLRFLFAKDCPSLEEIIASDLRFEPSEENLSMFLHLRQAYFFKLPNLKNICHKAMAFPSLERIYVHGCPSLRKLPLSLEKEEWWNQLEWDDEATKHVFSSKLIITTPQTGISIPQPSYTYEATIRPRYELICIEVENLMYYVCIFLMQTYF